MKQQELLQLITKYFSRFSEQVKIQNANSEFSINVHAENVLIQILNIIFDADFENTNYAENKNYASIDLRDRKEKFSIQVTATSNITKVKETLTTYIEKKHHKIFDKLIILVLTGRQNSYSKEAIDKVIEDNLNSDEKDSFNFDEKSNIIDFTHLYVKLNEQNDLDKIQKIKDLLEKQFSDIPTKSEIVKVENFKDLCKNIYPLLKENGDVFKRYGPNSSANSKEPLRRDMSLWYESRKEKILPNNRIISDLIGSNKSIIPSENTKVFENFLAHSFAFQKHCENPNFDYSEHLFPNKFYEIIENETK